MRDIEEKEEVKGGEREKLSGRGERRINSPFFYFLFLFHQVCLHWNTKLA
jgi:hypothetical protein